MLRAGGGEQARSRRASGGGHAGSGRKMVVPSESATLLSRNERICAVSARYKRSSSVANAVRRSILP